MEVLVTSFDSQVLYRLDKVKIKAGIIDLLFRKGLWDSDCSLVANFPAELNPQLKIACLARRSTAHCVTLIERFTEALAKTKETQVAKM